MNPSSSSHIILRAATEGDFSAIERISVEALNLSIPGRRLADELYDKENELGPNGKLQQRLARRLSEEHMWVAEHSQTGAIQGYVTWTDPQLGEKPSVGESGTQETPIVNEKSEYTPAEVSASVVFYAFKL